jgi:hypothetical protein
MILTKICVQCDQTVDCVCLIAQMLDGFCSVKSKEIQEARWKDRRTR